MKVNYQIPEKKDMTRQAVLVSLAAHLLVLYLFSSFSYDFNKAPALQNPIRITKVFLKEPEKQESTKSNKVVKSKPQPAKPIPTRSTHPDIFKNLALTSGVTPFSPSIINQKQEQPSAVSNTKLFEPARALVNEKRLSSKIAKSLPENESSAFKPPRVRRSHPGHPESFKQNFTPVEVASLPGEQVNIPNEESGIDSDAIIGAFAQMVRDKIAKAKYYPRIARSRGFEGIPVVEFILKRDGKLLKLSLGKRSEYRILDKAALETVKNAEPYPPIPETLKLETIKFMLPISFILE